MKTALEELIGDVRVWQSSWSKWDDDLIPNKPLSVDELLIELEKKYKVIIKE